MENPIDAAADRAFAFGLFVLVPARQALLQDGVPVRLGGRALDILTALVERAGELVSKRELMARVWPDTVVDESNLKVNVAALRRALGDGGLDDVRYIATVNGRGYRLIAPVSPGALSAGAPAAAAAPPRLHNLPTGTTRVVGRADAIDAIRRDFGVARLVTIVGPGGIGKTTVALAVAEHAIGSYRDGVWLVDLALTKAPHMTVSAIAAVVGAAGGAPDSLDMLCQSLRERDMLLVLDSCEHVIDACAACANAILAQAPGVRILVTSREPLRLIDERVRRLPGLATPPSPERLDAQEALMFPAVQLFVDSATDRVDSFVLRDEDAPAVAEICQRLDGLALAIELAATRIDAFGVGALLRQLPPASLAQLQALEATDAYDAPEYGQIMMQELYPRFLCRTTPWPDAVNRVFSHANQAIYNQMQGQSEFVVTGNLKDWERWDRLHDITVRTLTIGAKYDEMDPEDMRKMARMMPRTQHRTAGNISRRDGNTACKMPGTGAHPGNTSTSSPRANSSSNKYTGSPPIPKPCTITLFKI